MTACAATKAGLGTLTVPGNASATARPTSSAANRYDEGSPACLSPQPAANVATPSGISGAIFRIRRGYPVVAPRLLRRRST